MCSSCNSGSNCCFINLTDSSHGFHSTNSILLSQIYKCFMPARKQLLRYKQLLIAQKNEEGNPEKKAGSRSSQSMWFVTATSKQAFRTQSLQGPFLRPKYDDRILATVGPHSFHVQVSQLRTQNTPGIGPYKLPPGLISCQPLSILFQLIFS